jgi:SAM-dependent methyltransferase
MIIKPFIKGVLTLIPGMEKILPKGRTGGTVTAKYCYGVWLKHLTMLSSNGMKTIPNTIAELGPGDSLGIGLAAMLSGANIFYALDVVRYSNTAHNLKVFDELVGLFKARAARPRLGWPNYDMHLDGHLFPSNILTEAVLEVSLSEERIQRIRNALVNLGSENKGVSIKYMVPWMDNNIIEKESVDLILSHSVLEHVVDLESTYRAISIWLKPGGMMSHQIDFASHGLSEKWNGYRAYSEIFWKMLVGKRPYLLNRQPCSVHMEYIKRNGFEVICHLKNYRTDGIKRSQLTSRWETLADDDLTCSETFIQAKA